MAQVFDLVKRDTQILQAMREYTGRLTPHGLPFINALSHEGQIDPPVTYEERERLWPLARPATPPDPAD